MGQDQTYEGSSTSVIAGTRVEVWEWLRSVESALHWHPDCIDAYVVPNPGASAVEQRAFVSQHGAGATATAFYSLVESPHGDVLEYRSQTPTSGSFHIHLADRPGNFTEIRVTVKAKSPKKSFRRWENPTPGLNRQAATTVERMKDGYHRSTAPRRSAR